MDTDRDGLPDYAEKNLRCSQFPVRNCPTNPTNPDTDGDGLSDFDEVSCVELQRLAGFHDYFTGFVLTLGDSKAHGTDPTDTDTDDDGIQDGDEALTTYVVVLPDGSSRTVSSDPTRADTDADGLPDGAERTGLTDPTDPDTDDDQRVDGKEDQTIGLDPLIPDLQVTVHIERLDIEKALDDLGDLGFWVMVRNAEVMARSHLANPTLVADATDALCKAGQTPETYGCFASLKTPAKDEDHCPMLILKDRQTIQLKKDVKFVLRKGEFFTVDGLIGNFDGLDNGDTISNCGLAPNYVPMYFKASCYTRFNHIVNYSELEQGNRGEAVAFTTTDATATIGDDECQWNIISNIVVN